MHEDMEKCGCGKKVWVEGSSGTYSRRDILFTNIIIGDLDKIGQYLYVVNASGDEEIMLGPRTQMRP